VKLLVLGGAQGLEAEIVDDEQVQGGQFTEMAIVGAGGACGGQLGEHLGLGGEQDIVALADGTGADDEDGDLLLDEATGGQVVDEGLVDGGVEGEVKLFQGLLVSEVGASDGQAEPFVASAGQFVLEDHGQEIHVGHLLVDGLAVSGIEGCQDSGEAKLLEHGGQFGLGFHERISFPSELLDRGSEVAAEAAGPAIGFRQLGFDEAGGGLLIQSLLENGLHGTVPGVFVIQGSFAGGFEPQRAEAFAQMQDALDGPEVIQDAVCEQGLHEVFAAGAEPFGLPEAPLGVVHEESLGVGGEVFGDGGSLARDPEPGVDGHQVQVAKQLDVGFGGLQPQGFVDQGEGSGVEAFFELDMAIAVQLDLGPDRQFGRDFRQGLQQGALGFGEQGQGALLGRAVDAVTGFPENQGPQLLIAVGHGPEVAQGQETALDVFDAGFHTALLFRVRRGAGGDEEPVAPCTFGVGPLHDRIPEAGPGDGTLGIVDDQAPGHTPEELQGAAMTSQPGLHLLIRDNLGILVAAEGQGHDKHPGGDRLPAEDILDLGAGAEVHLRSLARGELQDGGGLRVGVMELLEKPADCGLAAGELVVADQGLVDGGALDPLLPPGLNLLPVWLDQGDLKGDDRLSAEHRCQGGIFRKGTLQPAPLFGRGTQIGCLAPAHQACLGNGPVGLPQPHADKDVAVLVHLEPPVPHAGSSCVRVSCRRIQAG